MKKKLYLRKVSIASLNASQLQKIQGGTGDSLSGCRDACQSDYCVTNTCNCPPASNGCSATGSCNCQSAFTWCDCQTADSCGNCLI